MDNSYRMNDLWTPCTEKTFEVPDPLCGRSIEAVKRKKKKKNVVNIKKPL